MVSMDSKKHYCPTCGGLMGGMGSAIWVDEATATEPEFASPKQRTKPYFTATIQIEIDEDVLADWRETGYHETAIIHEICDEIRGLYLPNFTYPGELEFIDCEIKYEP